MAEVPTFPAGSPPQHHPVAQTLALLHNWIDYVPQQQRRLGLFIFLAALVHFAMFFFIRIDTTRAELRHQPRVQVTLDNVDTSSVELPEEKFWDRMTDPRLYVLPFHSTPQAPDVADELQAMEQDSHPAEMPAPVEIGNYPFLNNSLAPLDQRVVESMSPARQPFAFRPPSRAVAKTTTWEWDDDLAQRMPSGVPALPATVSDTDISPTRLRIAVTPDGAVSDVLLEPSAQNPQSSDNPDLDRAAILAVQKVRFQPVDAPGLKWGLVTISWYYTPEPREVAPTPAPLAP